MIELIAIAPDGWALARTEREHWLLRPPYRRQDRDRMTEGQAMRAMGEEDFSSTHLVFADWGSLCRHVEDERVQRAGPTGIAQAMEGAERLLSHATTEQARRHFDRIREALEAGRAAQARKALIALLRAEAVQSDPALVQEAAVLLARTQAVQRQGYAGASVTHPWPVRDPDGVSRVAAALAERGSLLDPAA